MMVCFDTMIRCLLMISSLFRVATFLFNLHFDGGSHRPLHGWSSTPHMFSQAGPQALSWVDKEIQGIPLSSAFTCTKLTANEDGISAPPCSMTKTALAANHTPSTTTYPLLIIDHSPMPSPPFFAVLSHHAWLVPWISGSRSTRRSTPANYVLTSPHGHTVLLWVH